MPIDWFTVVAQILNFLVLVWILKRVLYGPVLRAIAERAMERKTGARGLRSILESVLLDSMYNIPSRSDVSKVVIDESVIRGDSEPLLVYQNHEPQKAAAPEE